MCMIEEEKEVATKVKERAASKELELEKHIAEERRLHLSRSNQLAQQNTQLQDHIKVYPVDFYKPRWTERGWNVEMSVRKIMRMYYGAEIES